MNYLLDTHTLIWCLSGDKRIPKNIQDIIDNNNNRLFYSIISPWELEIKHLIKKGFKATGKQLSFLCEQNYIELLNISNEHINNLNEVDKLNTNKDHKDPFDKMLISQAISEKMILVTHDKKMKYYKTKYILYF